MTLKSTPRDGKIVKILLGIILGLFFGSLGLVWALNLIDPSASEPIANESNDLETKEVAETNNQTGYFQNYDFPLDSCGDKDPGGSNAWYPVYIANTEHNFNSIRSNFCQDAIRKYRKEQQITSIQVSSFTDRSKAEEFASLMQNNLGSGEVGEPTVRDFSKQNISSSSQNSSKLNTYKSNRSLTNTPLGELLASSTLEYVENNKQVEYVLVMLKSKVTENYCTLREQGYSHNAAKQIASEETSDAIRKEQFNFSKEMLLAVIDYSRVGLNIGIEKCN